MRLPWFANTRLLTESSRGPSSGVELEVGVKGGGARGRERNRGSLVSSFLYKDASPIGLESHPYDLI